MSLSGFVFFVTGVLIEMLMLLGAKIKDEALLSHPQLKWLSQVVTVKSVLTYSLLLTAMALAAIFELTGVGNIKVYINTPFVSLITIILALVILAASLAAAYILPPINEHSILTIQLLILAGIFLNPGLNTWMPLKILAILSGGISLALVIWQKALHTSVKAVLYFWYLLSLLIIPFQSGEIILFQKINLSWFDAFALGMLMVFMLLNGLFAVRFFLIVSSLLRPRNHSLVARHMPFLFSDQQVSIPRYLLVVGLLATLITGNYFLNLFNSALLFSLCSLIGVQLLGNDMSVSRFIKNKP